MSKNIERIEFWQREIEHKQGVLRTQVLSFEDGREFVMEYGKEYLINPSNRKIHTLEIKVKPKKEPIEYKIGGLYNNVVTCNKQTLSNAIDQLKEVANSIGLKAVITFETE